MQLVSQAPNRAPADSDYFIPAALAGSYADGRGRQIQEFGEEFDACLIGAPINRRRGQGDLQRVSQFTYDRVSPCAGLDLHSESNARRGFMQGDHVLYDNYCSLGSYKGP
jgi:hypothetical protein